MIVRLLAVCLLVCAAAAPGFGVPNSARSPAIGTFTDSSGAAHSWKINGSHALIWDGQPYLPVGAVFQSRFLAGVTTDSSWHADLAQLAAFKKHHVMSILIEPMGPPGSLLETPPAAVQALIDILDSEGFTYGFALEGSPTKEWDSALVRPTVYRDPAPPEGANVTFRNISGLIEADYYLVSSHDGSVLAHGKAAISDDVASVQLQPGDGGDGTVLLVYPVTHMGTGPDSKALPDVWSGADDFRDSLLLYFSRIKFGKGLRFFLDPIRVDGDLFATTAGGMIPDDDDFRIRFQTWLLERYGHSRVRLNDSWGVKNQDLTDFAVAARCLLLYQAKGLALLLDPVTGKTYDAVPAKSAIWSDISLFQVSAIQRSMNDVADAVKQGIANVPVVYRWTQASPAFVNSGPAGFDGLWVSPTAHGQKIVAAGAGYAFAACEQAHRSQWLLAGFRGIVDAGSSAPTDGSADPSKSQFKADRVAADQVGVKAVFVAPPDGAQWTDGETRWLDWVHSDATDRTAIGSSFALDKPGVVFFPTNVSLPGASIQPLGDNLWWLPTFQDGTLLDLGRQLEGYRLSGPADAPSFVVYATGTASVAAVFRFSPLANPTAVSAAGLPAPLVEKKGMTTITFTQAPVIIAGVTELPLPNGASDDEMKEAERLIADGDLSRIPMDTYLERLYYIKNSLMIDPNENQQVAYDNIKLLIGQLQTVISPYNWIEGEATVNNSFDGVVAADSASEHAFLWIDSSREPPGGAQGLYKATYDFAVNAPGIYTVWAAIAPGAPGTTGVSPIFMSTDTSAAVDISRPVTGGAAYGTLPIPTASGSTGGFIWCNLGQASLVAGAHTLTITLGGRAPVTNRYTLGIDALCVAGADFSPDGIRQPHY